MSITTILNNIETPASKKLQEVAAIVSKVRETYGNSDMQIAAPEVNTASGFLSFTHLNDESKVAMLCNEAHATKIRAIEYSNNVEGVNINRKLEELIATNGMFTNIIATDNFSYI